MCIMGALGTRPPEWSGSCPLCRKHISVYNLRDLRGKQLASADVQSIYGCIFVQQGGKGKASYHFDSEEECYISYESAPPVWRLDDGSRPPPKKKWNHTSFDAETLTFRGVIFWDPAFNGETRWDYEITFAEDFAGIVGGRVTSVQVSGTEKVTPFLPPWEESRDPHLAYYRWSPPCTTIFGSVYVQGLSYVGWLEGIASYHFDAEDDCYISYTNAPSDWLLDNGAHPPAKKPFEHASYDPASRTFRGAVNWDPSFGGSVRWEYTLVFSEDLRSISGGSMRPFGPGGTRQPECLFGNPWSILGHSDRILCYVQKPSVLSLSQRVRAELMLAERPQEEVRELPEEQVVEVAAPEARRCVIS